MFTVMFDLKTVCSTLREGRAPIHPKFSYLLLQARENSSRAVY